jgi:hypothetical protein
MTQTLQLTLPTRKLLGKKVLEVLSLMNVLEPKKGDVSHSKVWLPHLNKY